MITDNFGVFFEGAIAASATSPSIEIMPYMGRGEPRIITVQVAGGTAANTIALTLAQSTDNTTFTTAATYSFTKVAGRNGIFSFSLPMDIKGEFVRLAYSASGTITGVTIFAGFTRDHFAPYSEGQFIDSGRVVA